MTQAEARLPLLTQAGWDRHTPNVLRAIAHHPRLLEPFLGFASALAVPPEDGLPLLPSTARAGVS